MCRPEQTAVRSGGWAMLGGKQTDCAYYCSSPWPLVRSPYLVIALLLPVLPLKSMLFNAGYTKWFHWVSLVHLITQNKFLSKFLAVMGMTVTLGWWASMLYDLFLYGRLAHILHLNMPFTDRMVVAVIGNGNSGNSSGNSTLSAGRQTVVYNEYTLPYIFVSHVLDMLGHPVLALYYWKINGWDMGRIFTWPVLVSAYLLSRTWSLVRLSLRLFLDCLYFCHSKI
jgi:hypothetical protein